jgi:CheY-like chemotaxis protein
VFVLVVDDHEDARDGCAQYLEVLGLRVATAEDGVDAVDKALALHPDVILMDLSMPRLDGFEATRRIKADPRTRDIPVIALTALSGEGTFEKARAAGCDGLLRKPAEFTQVTSEISRVVQRGN